MPTNSAYPTNSSGWTNSSNANANDGAFATATAKGQSVPGWVTGDEYTPNLLCGTFTGLDAGMGASDGVTSITLNIGGKSTIAACDFPSSVYLAVAGVQKVNFNIGWPFFTTTNTGYSQTITGGAELAALTKADVTAMQVVIACQNYNNPFATDTISIDYALLSVTYAAVDTTPDAFAFSSQTNVAPSTSLNSSNVATISGLSTGTPSPITVSGGQYSKNGGAYTSSAGTVVNGDTVRANVTSSASFSTAATATITIGGVAGTFTVTTRAADTTPDAFTFVDVTGAATSTLYTSNTITVSGIDSAANVTFTTSGGTGHQYSKNGGAYTNVGAITVVNGDTLAVRFTSPAAPTFNAYDTVTIGGVSDTYSVTDIDTVPNAFGFTSALTAIPDTIVTSDVVVLAGMTAAIPVSASVSAGGGFKVNSGSWVTTATVVNGDSVSVRATSSNIPEATVIVTLTINSVQGTFTIKSRPYDGNLSE